MGALQGPKTYVFWPGRAQKQVFLVVFGFGGLGKRFWGLKNKVLGVGGRCLWLCLVLGATLFVVLSILLVVVGFL